MITPTLLTNVVEGLIAGGLLGIAFICTIPWQTVKPQKEEHAQ